MSCVPSEPGAPPPAEEGAEACANLRREIDAIKAHLEEHRTVMRLAGLTSADGAGDADSPQEQPG